MIGKIIIENPQGIIKIEINREIIKAEIIKVEIIKIEAKVGIMIVNF